MRGEKISSPFQLVERSKPIHPAPVSVYSGVVITKLSVRMRFCSTVKFVLSESKGVSRRSIRAAKLGGNRDREILAPLPRSSKCVIRLKSLIVPCCTDASPEVSRLSLMFAPSGSSGKSSLTAEQTRQSPACRRKELRCQFAEI